MAFFWTFCRGKHILNLLFFRSNTFFTFRFKLNYRFVISSSSHSALHEWVGSSSVSFPLGVNCSSHCLHNLSKSKLLMSLDSEFLNMLNLLVPNRDDINETIRVNNASFNAVCSRKCMAEFTGHFLYNYS